MPVRQIRGLSAEHSVRRYVTNSFQIVPDCVNGLDLACQQMRRCAKQAGDDKPCRLLLLRLRLHFIGVCEKKNLLVGRAGRHRVASPDTMIVANPHCTTLKTELLTPEATTLRLIGGGHCESSSHQQERTSTSPGITLLSADQQTHRPFQHEPGRGKTQIHGSGTGPLYWPK